MSETAVIALVRSRAVERDGYCRVAKNVTLGFLGACDGPSEWAHFGPYRRFHTRKQAPAARHTTVGSMMLCRLHHMRYDQHKFQIEAMSVWLCDGPLRFTQDQLSYEEPTR